MAASVDCSKDQIHETQDKVKTLYEKYLSLNEKLLNCGVSIDDLENVCWRKRRMSKSQKQSLFSPIYILTVSVIAAVCLSVLLKIPMIESVMKRTLGSRCLLPNNYFVWEATRPVADCNTCRNVADVLIFENITRQQFKKYAYSPRPMLMKGAALHWPAMNSFNYSFLKDMYEKIDGAYESVEDECQILTFKTEFTSLKDVFSMPESRVELRKGEMPWYVGWSNCHPDVLSEMRHHYELPHFLPEDAEHARMDYIFIGYEQGAVMHIDYISRLMWQAQIRGHKTWKLVPPPECEDECSPITFRVEPGDIGEFGLSNFKKRTKLVEFTLCSSPTGPTGYKIYHGDQLSEYSRFLLRHLKSILLYFNSLLYTFEEMYLKESVNLQSFILVLFRMYFLVKLLCKLNFKL